MRCYVVGGAVRDELLGRPVTDRDWVVVGATPEELRARGFRPVGADFPVFLHPETREEYALARLERKVAPGYRGFSTEFSPEVTLEEDLRRRDLTVKKLINKEITSHINISDADVKNFYDANRPSFNLAEPQIHIAQIMVTPMPDPNVRNLKNSKALNDQEAKAITSVSQMVQGIEVLLARKAEAAEAPPPTA